MKNYADSVQLFQSGRGAERLLIPTIKDAKVLQVSNKTGHLEQNRPKMLPVCTIWGHLEH